ncbi:MAG: hypothetical protein GF308_21635 [Candidatus Heimdallarchaeota archaeon]|nr:hypothetical protein [Candidatus Heimdallarchaeota archaeon]
MSKINLTTFKEAIDNILKIRNVRGLLLFTYTPYIGCDKSILLIDEERNIVIDRFIKIKKKYPIKISNTFPGLRALKRNDRKRPIWSSIVINQGKITNCCCREGIYDANTCHYCGCTPAIETYMLEQLKPLAIIDYLKFLLGG